MIQDFILIANRRGAIRVVKKVSSLKTDEVAISMKLTIPNALFERPQLKAEVTIPKEVALSNPINAQVINNVEEAIKVSTGISFKVSLEKPESEDSNVK